MDFSLVQIDLQTGRPHQIGYSFRVENILYLEIKDMVKNLNKVGQQIVLWSYKIEIDHPTTTKKKWNFVCDTKMNIHGTFLIFKEKHGEICRFYIENLRKQYFYMMKEKIKNICTKLIEGTFR